MTKIFFTLLISCLAFPTGVLANQPNTAKDTPVVDQVNQSNTTEDTLIVDQAFALSRVLPVEVTPSGIAIKLDSKINSAQLSHLGKITILGIDGTVCIPEINCEDLEAPSAILLRTIPEIKGFEEDQVATKDNTIMLFVTAESGLYRFKLNPNNDLPKITKVEIRKDPVEPLF